MKYIKIGDYSTHEKTRDSMSIYLDLARQRRLGMGNGFSLQLLSYRKSLPTSWFEVIGRTTGVKRVVYGKYAV